MVFFVKKNILIPNVAEKNILILVEEKKIIWFRGQSSSILLSQCRASEIWPNKWGGLITGVERSLLL
jgi:hypothetical protein